MSSNSIENNDEENKKSIFWKIKNKFNRNAIVNQSPEQDKNHGEGFKKDSDFSAIDHKYLIKHGSLSQKYLSRYNHKTAFKDTGTKLKVYSKVNSSLLKDVVAVAKYKQWETIKVKGSKEFKAAAWLEAKVVGMDVAGYKPNRQDERMLEERLKKYDASRTNKSEQGLNNEKDIEKVNNKSQEKTNSDLKNLTQQYVQSITSDKKSQMDLTEKINNMVNNPKKIDKKPKVNILSGKLIEHGDINNNENYFVKLKNSDGKVRTITNPLLKDVMTKNSLQKGDQISLERKNKKNENIEINNPNGWNVKKTNKNTPENQKTVKKEVDYDR